ncbi:hypothetical protein ACQ4PT_059726 [Festuca glaucescens]
MEERRSARQGQEPTVARGSGDESDDEFEFEFEFSFGGREPAATSGAAADELVYPVFGRVFEDARAAPPAERSPLRRLFLEEARNSSVGSTSSTCSSYSSAAADLDGASPDTYCVWTPGASPASSPARSPRKSGSTGSLSRWRRVSQLVVGRSSSVGRDKFGFLSAPASPAREEQPKAKPAAGRKGKAATETGTVAASHRMFYGGAKASPGAPRRTFLPYRQDLVGLFSAPKGLSRSQFQYQPAI